VCPRLREIVESKLELRWSPQQIAARQPVFVTARDDMGHPHVAGQAPWTVGHRGLHTQKR
jgi:hypothetical protein